jgi:hypothetical protein
MPPRVLVRYMPPRMVDADLELHHLAACLRDDVADADCADVTTSASLTVTSRSVSGFSHLYMYVTVYSWGDDDQIDVNMTVKLMVTRVNQSIIVAENHVIRKKLTARRPMGRCFLSA